MKLTALWAPEQQFQHKDGSILVAGKIYVYNLDRTQLVTTYANGSGTVENPNPIILDGNGRALCFANEEFKYTAVVCDYYGKELFSFEPVGLGGSGSDAQVSTEITSETLNVEKTFDPHTNTNTFDIELKDKDIDHWIGQHGAPIQISGDSQEAALPLPDTNHRDYVGSFIDRIEDGKYMYLKPGIYQVDCLIGFTQSDGDLQNDLGQVLVYTGNGSADESEAWQLDGAGPYANDNRHNLHASFVRKVLDEGQTSNVDCSNLLYFAPGTPFTWSEAFIQRLSIVRLDSISTGSGEGGSGIERVIHDDTLSGDGTGESPLSCSGALEGKQDKLIPGDGISIINNVISCSAQGGGGGPTYTAGQYIDITPENVINVSGLQPAGEYLTPEDLEGYATTEDVERATSGKLDASAYRAPVQSDWNQTNSSALDYIKNKPTIPSLDGYATQQYVIEQTSGKLDASDYTAPVNADWNSEGGLSEILNKPDVAGLIPGQGITFTPDGDNYVISSTASGDVSKQYVDQAILSATSGKLDASDYTAPEQSDWNEADAADLAYIKNKPVEIGFIAGDGIRFEDLSSAIKISCSAQGGSTYTAGTGIDITNDVISVTSAVAMKSDIPAAQVQSDWTEADDEDPAFIKNKPSEYELIAGAGVSITPSGTNYIISSTGGGGGGSTYTAGDGIDITADVISVTSAIAKKSDLPDMSTYATKAQLPTTELGKFTIPSNVSGGPIEVICPADVAGLGEIWVKNPDAVSEYYTENAGTQNEVQGIRVKSPGFDQSYWNAPANTTLVIDFAETIPANAEIYGYYDMANGTRTYYLINPNPFTKASDATHFEIPIITNSSTSGTFGTLLEFYITCRNASSSVSTDVWRNATMSLVGPDASQGIIVDLKRYKLINQVATSTPGSSLECQVTENSDHQQRVYLPTNFPSIWGETVKFVQYGATSLPSNFTSSGASLVVAYKSLGSQKAQFARLVRSYGSNSTAGYMQKHVFEYIDPDDNHVEYWIATAGFSSYTWTTETVSFATSAQLATKQDQLQFTYDSNDDIIGINGSGIGGTGGGSSYTAGTGIDITNDVISIDPSVVPSKTDLQSKLDTSAYVAPVNSDWTAETGLAQILNKPDTEEMDVQELSAGPGISINNGVISVSGQYLTQADLAGYATQTWVGQQGFLESSDLAGYATQEWVGQQGFLTSIPSSYATDTEVSNAVAAGTSGKQNKLTSVTDVQLVNALPASPVAGVLYLIPEA